nr:class I adenylate-forming enzyme family protein [Kibdelosporangium sp. MJ126-NF4]CEL13021.1 Long-chain-fatty-acid--CoA ligase [Kibdelosporangium sp. MJ126-NF4]CTQ98707.1 Long-chain-fatty-acid--CoA ligase (EC 6.2.1.3) [Kibdelosporangium sp. MJ126-NF4]
MSLLHELLDTTAERQPDRPAVRCGEAELTYRSLTAHSERIAAWLRSVGVRRQDRVIVALPIDVLVPAVLYACSRVGCVFVVLREDTPATVAAHVLDDAQPALVLTEPTTLADLAERRGIACHGWDVLRSADAERLPVGGPVEVDPVCFIYTSGTTAMPKAVVSTHQQATFAVRAIQSQLAYQADDVVYGVLPLSFDYGLYQIFLATAAGSVLHLAVAGGHRVALDLHDTGATVLPAVPSLVANLAKLLSRRPQSLPRLRLLTNTGAAMPTDLLTVLRERLPALRVQLMYGLTECKRATIMPKDEDLRRPGACGRALPGTEVFVVDPDGTRLPTGEIGEVVVRGPNVMAGYWRRPELTAHRFPRADDLFPQLRTGDYGWLDDDGYLYFAGRRDDLYKERGFRVSTVEVEAAAHRIPGVDAAVVLPPSGGQEGATLLAQGDVTAEDVLRALRDHLDEVKIPARCVIVPEIPLNANGKVARSALAGLAGAG